MIDLTKNLQMEYSCEPEMCFAPNNIVVLPSHVLFLISPHPCPSHPTSNSCLALYIHIFSYENFFFSHEPQSGDYGYDLKPHLWFLELNHVHCMGL